MWDGENWTDESTYLISAQGNDSYGGRLGGLVVAECDFELENTSERFSPTNENSPIQNALKPSVSVRFSVIINDIETVLFTGKIKSIEPDEGSGKCDLHCFDNASKIMGRTVPSDIYLNKYYHEVIELLALNAGLTAADYDLEESTVLLPAVYFDEDKKTDEIMSEIATAERGRVFFDSDGKLHLWNKYHFIEQQPLSIVLTRANWLKSIKYSVEEQDIVNQVSVSSTPRAPDGLQVVWSNGDAVASNQYNTPLVWIPAESYQNAWIELDDPCIEWTTPIATTDFTANSLAAGGGDDLTSYISITQFVTYKNQAFIQVTNSGETDAFLTEFNIRANPIKIYNWIKTVDEDQNSIDKYGVQDITIENNWIADSDTVEAIVNYEIALNSEAKQVFQAEIMGLPTIRTGEVVTVEISSGNYASFQIKNLDWTLDSSGFNQSLELAFRGVIETALNVSEGIASGMIGIGMVGVSNNLKGIKQTASARVKIA